MDSHDGHEMEPTGDDSGIDNDAARAAGSEETDETAAAPLPPNTPRRIAGFRIRRRLASGGMGTVYLAMQDEPRRQVALKIMRAGLASREALRRFRYESQILARLHHPNIAQVYEAGTHEEDDVIVPYFAMEYIPGARPVTEYVRARKLGLHERLELFATICDAVHHGHQRGIIHRDLKPGNILVDSDGMPKIIDFGVARAVDSDMAVTTQQTDIGQLVGTLPYMSPEQCEGDPTDLDTRSDVYGLGVVLYEMLTEHLPYDLPGPRSALFEALRVIREQPPQAPSNYNPAVRGDVETITLKALEKDRTRRYDTASSFREDIERYLRHEPITAHPPSVAYQLQLFARRHRGFMAATATVAAVLVVATVVSVWFAWRAGIARDDAVVAQTAAEEENRRFAAAQLALMDIHALGNAEFGTGPELTAGEMMRWLDADRIARYDHAIRPTLLLLSGQLHAAVEEYETARELLEHAVDMEVQADPESRGTASAKLALAYVLRMKYEDPSAIDLLKDVEAVHSTHSASHTDRVRLLMEKASWSSEWTLGDRVTFLENAIAILGDLASRTRLEEIYLAQCRTMLANRILEYLPGDPARDLARALRLHEESNQQRINVLGAEHQTTAVGIHHQATAVAFDGGARAQSGDTEGAKERWEAARRQGYVALAIRETTVGPESPQFAQSLSLLSQLASLMTDHAEAIRLSLRAVDVYRQQSRINDEDPDEAAEWHSKLGLQLRQHANLLRRAGLGLHALAAIEESVGILEARSHPRAVNARKDREAILEFTFGQWIFQPI